MQVHINLDPDSTKMALSLATSSLSLAGPVRMSANPDAPIKLGVNGFGRIGRQVVRIAMDRESFVLKHINSPMSPEYMKYLLEHDTVRPLLTSTPPLQSKTFIHTLRTSTREP